MHYTKQQLKRYTLSHSFFPPTTLRKAVEQLTFIQIDPIRSPAVAQDLILRQRVENYHAGDIDREAQVLGLEEDFLYAHGYMTREIWSLLHPRKIINLTEFDKEVLRVVRTLKEIHPRELDVYFEKKQEVNWWGGYSRAAKMSLERLHYYGLLRVVRREKGIRIYQAFSREVAMIPLEERLSQLVLTIVNIMAPVTPQTLSQSLHRIHSHFGNTRSIINKLVKAGKLSEESIEEQKYLWLPHSFMEREIPATVKFVCPFDPIVRDRIRFEHLWGWLYQFEAYVPPLKRIRGYYAMPVLWGENMIGWANVKVSNKTLTVDLGFSNGRPRSKAFAIQLEKEIDRMQRFYFSS